MAKKSSDTTLPSNITADSTLGEADFNSNDLSRVFEDNCRTDPNEDYCAVCNDGGELVCCSLCPKVYHYECHIPKISINVRKEENWKCTLCTDVNTETVSSENKRKRSGLGTKELAVCENILLKVMCHSCSPPFHQRVHRKVPNYYKIIKQHMELALVRTKMSPSHFEHYKQVTDFLDDMILMFRNCYTYNRKDTPLFNSGKKLEKYFRNLLKDYLPQYVNYFSEDKLIPECGYLNSDATKQVLDT